MITSSPATSHGGSRTSARPKRSSTGSPTPSGILECGGRSMANGRKITSGTYRPLPDMDRVPASSPVHDERPTVFLAIANFTNISNILRGKLIRYLASKYRVVVLSPYLNED